MWNQICSTCCEYDGLFRPEENIEAVEVSAYDLKDHPDFKFRPAQTVIRVIETQVSIKENLCNIVFESMFLLLKLLQVNTL